MAQLHVLKLPFSLYLVFISYSSHLLDTSLERSTERKDDDLDQDLDKPDDYALSSPQKSAIQGIITTPHKLPDVVSISNAFTPSSNYCNAINAHVERMLGNSPYAPHVAKPRASPFIPFCRENLSPLCTVEANFASSNSKRVLFSPLYLVRCLYNL